MLKVQYRVNPDMMLELEGADQKQLFQVMANAAEIFGAPWVECGCCRDRGFKPRPVVRTNKDGNSFYELHCTKPGCRARFAFGQHKKTASLFPQREYPKGHPQAGQLKPNGGWVAWDAAAAEDVGE